jgi:ADP-ribose pyrophosphatase YjhB (NUDIX family)
MPNLTVATIIMKDRANVLLVKPNEGPDDNLWAIPEGVVAEGETVRNACIRSVKEALGLDIEPKMTLFICERVVPNDHRLGIFVLAEPVPLTELNEGFGQGEMLILKGGIEEARWVGVQSLGELQKKEGMSEFTASAFFKFSEFLKSNIPSVSRSN